MANDFNTVTLSGNLTRDPELRYTNSGTSVCSFTLAVNSGSGDYVRTDFINFVAWKGLADTIANYVRKGDELFTMGELQTRSYETDNGTRYITEVILRDFKFGKQAKANQPDPTQTKNNQGNKNNTGNRNQGNRNNGK